MELKPHLDWDAQLLRLKERGLVIDDDALALQTLKHHNYYRLRGYFHVFLTDQKTESGLEMFKPDTNLDDLTKLIDFDFRLRGLLFEALSQFELSLRTSFAYHGGLISPELHVTGEGLTEDFRALSFAGKQDHNAWLQEYKKRVTRMGSEAFVRWHLENYGGALPIWVAVEIMDFGSLSKLFRSSSQKLGYAIASEYDCTPTLLKSWTASLNDLRNSVAHQNRLWNGVYALAPKTVKNQIHPDLLHLDAQDDYGRHKIYSRLAILTWLDAGNRFNVNFKNRLRNLLDDFPSTSYTSLTQMGFPAEWENLAIWQF